MASSPTYTQICIFTGLMATMKCSRIAGRWNRVMLPYLIMLVLVLATKSPYAQAGSQDELDDQSSITGEQNLSRGLPKRNTMWPLQSVESQNNLNRLFCGRNMTPPGPFCNLKGGVAYLLAGRFEGSSAPGKAADPTSSRAGSKAWSTARNVPWIIADYQLPITKWPRQSGAPVGAAPPSRSQIRLQRHTQVPVQD